MCKMSLASPPPQPAAQVVQGVVVGGGDGMMGCNAQIGDACRPKMTPALPDFGLFQRAIEVVCMAFPRLKADGKVDKTRAMSYT